jgi:hypothetical protein
MGEEKNSVKNLAQRKFHQLTEVVCELTTKHLVVFLFSDHLCGNTERTDAFTYLIHTLLQIQILKTTKFAIYIKNVNIS